MCVRILPFLVIFFSLNVVLVQNFFISWGSSSADSIEADVEANINAAESAAVAAAAEVESEAQEAAAETVSGFSSLYGRVRGKIRDIRSKMSDLFNFDDDFNVSMHVNQLLNLAPRQLAVVQDMLGNWSERARDYARSEWEFRRQYLRAAKNDLEGAITALSDGNYDAAMDYFTSALENVRDESAIYRALRYALLEDNSMLPMVSDLSYSLLEQLEVDLSAEGK